MKSKQTKIFEINNVKYQFDQYAFKAELKIYKDREKIRNISKVFDVLADTVSVTPEAVKQWYYGNNGPSDIEMILKIAKSIGIGDYLKIMKKAKENKKVANLSTLQIESTKRVYDAIIDYLNDFYKTDGFTGALWYEFLRKGSKDPEQDIYEYAESKIAEVQLVLQKEYFYLRNTEIYADILEYVENDLYNIFDGKLSYAYRFEAIPDGNPATYADYTSALTRLESIIERYI